MEKSASVDISILRKINQRAVLEEVYNVSTTSRTALSKSLSMSKPAITANLANLIELGIIQEVGDGAVTANGGRKPKLLSFNKDHRYIVTVDLNYRNPLFVLGNLKNEVISEFSMQVSNETLLESYDSIIKSTIKVFLKSRGLSGKDLACIAIASPGVFDNESRLLSENERYGGVLWGNLDFHRLLGEQFETKVIISNDIKAATLGEWAHGCGNSVENMLYVSCGVGLGLGIILESHLFGGSRFSAGEIYNYTDYSRSLEGLTVEDAVSIQSLLARVRADIAAGTESTLQDVNGTIGFENIVDAYGQNDFYVRSLVTQICREIALIAYNGANLLSTDKVVFGGEYVVFGDCLVSEFQALCREFRAFEPSVGITSLGKYAGIHGLLYLAREYYFDRICANP